MKQIAVSLAALALFGLATVAHAQVNYFPNDATIDTPLPGNAYIGWDFARNPSSPTVNLVPGGSIDGSTYVLNGSQFQMTGGSISQSLDTNDTSTTTIKKGTISNGLQANDNSVVNLYGGSFGADLYANDNSSIHLFGTNLSASVVSNFGIYTAYALSGKLADGTDLSNRQLFVQSTASYTLGTVPGPNVPEPGSLALLCGMGVIGTGLLRRKYRR